MARQLVAPLLAVVLLPHSAAAQFPCVYPPVPCPVVILPPGCVPGSTAPAGPTIVPERMETPKKSPTSTGEIPVKAEEVATPKPADTKTEKVIPPVPEDRIPAQGVPAKPATPAPPEKFEFPPLDKPKPDAPKTPGEIKPLEFDLQKLGGPAQPVEAKSSPLANERAAAVDVFARENTGVKTAKRGVTFVNKSARDVLLTVDGQTTTLPSKTVLTVELPAAFKWQMGGEPERSEQVPDGSPGVDVVIRK